MRTHRLISSLVLAATALFPAATAVNAQGGPPSWSIDVLSNTRYPQLKDSWMMRINDRGVAGGYISTETTFGPYLPATYGGGGQFATFGLQGDGFAEVTGLNDQGDMVGNLYDEFFDSTPFIVSGGVGRLLDLPAGALYPFVAGINDSGLSYGFFTDADDGLTKMFTSFESTLTVLPLAAPGLTNFDTNPSLLNDAGVLGVFGHPDNYATTTNLLYNLATSTLTPLATPSGFVGTLMSQVLDGFVFGLAYTNNGGPSIYGLWNLDGTFRGAFDVPDGVTDVRLNDRGWAVGIDAGGLAFFDGTSWSLRPVEGLGSGSLASIDDFNNRGDFVGLVDAGRGFAWGYRATAVPEPSSLVLGTVGLAVAGVVVRRRAARRGS